MPLARELEEAAGQIAVKSDFGDLDLVDIIIGSIEELTGIDLSLLEGIIDAIQGALGGIADVGAAIFNGIANAISGFIRGLLELLDFATFGLFNLDELGGAMNQTYARADEGVSLANGAATAAATAQASAEAVVTTAEAAANAAANATTIAERAYEAASYMENEALPASGIIDYGVNELRMGMRLNVPVGKVRYITRINFALESQPGGLTIETKLYNATRTSSSVIHTAVLGTNVTNRDIIGLEIPVADGERVFWNITAIGGSTVPQVLDACVFSVIVDP